MNQPKTLLDYTESCHANWRDLWPYLADNKLKITLLFLAIGLFSAVAVILPELVKHISRAIASGQVSLLVWLSLGVLCFFVGRGALNFCQNTLVGSIALKATNKIRLQVFEHILKLDLAFYASARLGDLNVRITGDIGALALMVEQLFQQTIPAVVTAVVLLIYLCYLNYYLTLAILLVAPILGFSFSYLGRRITQYASKAQQSISNLSSCLSEFIAGVKVVKTFAKEKFEFKQFKKMSEAYRHRQYLIQVVMALQWPILGALQGVCIVVIILVSGYCIHHHMLTVPQFLGYITAVALLVDPLQKIAQNYSAIKNYEVSIRRIFAIFDIQPELTPSVNPITIKPDIKRDIVFEQVEFNYQDAKPVLNKLSLQFPENSMTGIVGLSGAGKSTVLNLIMRFYDPTAGRVLLGGHDLRDYQLQSLRQQFGVVLQETYLFPSSIAENIAYGVDQIDMTRVEEVARLAHAHEFIQTFEQGYQTVVAERGTNLSGGQKQRIAIARALYANPKIIIFDEATSNIDAHSEAAIQASIESLQGRYTIIVVAHRLSTIRHADQIMVLGAGDLIEQGTHHELCQAQGAYFNLCQQQMSAV